MRLGTIDGSALPPPPPQYQEVMSSIKQLAIRGAFWTLASYGAGQVLRFGNNLALAHLLKDPELFGLMALITTFIVGLSLFSDVGLGLNVIQNKRGDDPDFLNTVWTIQVIRGCALWIACLLITMPLANFYEEPQFVWLLPIVGFISTVIPAFNATSLYTADRRMIFGRQITLDLITQIISISVMLLWAWLRPSIWALVVGSTVSNLLRLFWSHFLLLERDPFVWNKVANPLSNTASLVQHFLVPPERNKFTWDKAAVAEIFTMGRWIFVSTAFTFLAEQGDRLVLGKLFSLQTLGVYGIALTLSDLPRSITIAVSGKVIFPAVSKLSELPRPEFRAKILRNRRPLLLILILGMALLIGFGDRAILFLYPEKFKAAAWMLPILTVGIWPRLICATIEPTLFALGTFKYTTVGNIFRLVFTISAILLGFHWLGVPGAIIAVALNDLFYYLAVAYGLHQEGMGCLMQDLQMTGLLLALIAIALGVRSFLGLGLPTDGWLSP